MEWGRVRTSVIFLLLSEILLESLPVLFETFFQAGSEDNTQTGTKTEIKMLFFSGVGEE